MESSAEQLLQSYCIKDLREMVDDLNAKAESKKAGVVLGEPVPVKASATTRARANAPRAGGARSRGCAAERARAPRALLSLARARRRLSRAS